MSKQLTLSSIIAVLAMMATALIATIGPVGADRGGADHVPFAQQAADTLPTS